MNQQQPTCLPREWIDRIFALMACTYGRKFADMWAGQDAEMVKAVWAEKLGGFRDQPESIKYALDLLSSREWPPTLPEFIGDCRRSPRKSVLAIDHKLTTEEIERNRKRLAQMADSLARSKAA